jgi:hypothetical protein
MTDQDFGAVTALEFRVSPKQGFEDIVEEFDISFRPLGTTRRSLIWDGDDVVMIERDAIRIVLGWLPAKDEETSSFLIVAVGQAPNTAGIEVDEHTCAMINLMVQDHAASYLPVWNVLRADVEGPVDPDLVDIVAETLRNDYHPDPSQDQPGVRPSPWGYASHEADPAYALHPRRGAVSQEPQEDEVEDADYRDLAAPAPISLPQRLTIYTLGATMLLYTPPVGATLLVYSTLRDLAPAQPTRFAA